MKEVKVKTIKISPKTHDRLNKIGKRGETYEDIVVRLLDFYEDGNRDE